MIWEIFSSSHTLKHVVPHLDTPTSASIIWINNRIDCFMLVTSCADGELRVWNCDSEGLHFSADLNGPEAEPVLNIFPTSKTSFISFDKSGSGYEWKKKVKTNTWKGKRRYVLTDSVISDVFFSKIYSQGFVLTNKGLKVFEGLTGKSNSFIEDKIAFESVDQIYVDDEGLYLFYVILYENVGALKCYCLKDKLIKIISSDIGTDKVVSMAFHLKLGLLALTQESGTLRLFKVIEPKRRSKKWAPVSAIHRTELSNMDSILNDLHSYICGDSDVPLNRFPVETHDPQEEKSEDTFSISNDEGEQHDDKTFSVSSKEGARTYSISNKSSQEDS